MKKSYIIGSVIIPNYITVLIYHCSAPLKAGVTIFKYPCAIWDETRKILKKEGIMTVEIIIERKFKEDPLPEDLQAINELRMKAMQQKGYVSGETLLDLEDERTEVVLSVWSSLDDWKTWLNSQERCKLESELTPHLEETVKIRPFMLGADGISKVFAKFVHDSEAAPQPGLYEKMVHLQICWKRPKKFQEDTFIKKSPQIDHI